MDRVKESLFSSIQSAVPGATVLDLYAGAGSFGIEAISRGAATVVFVESARAALTALRSNLTALTIDAEVVGDRVDRFLSRPSGPYDLVFCDPPWPLPTADLRQVLESVAAMCVPGAILVVTRRTGDETPEPAGMRISDVRRHGDTTIIRYET